MTISQDTALVRVPGETEPAMERGQEGRGRRREESEVQRSPQGLPLERGAGTSTRCRPDTGQGAAPPGQFLPPRGSASLS